MAYWALAEERTGSVDALAASAEGPVLLTLVDVHAHLHHWGHLKALMTAACEASLCVDAGSVAAHSVENSALVNIHTLEAFLVQGKTLVASAGKRANGILAPSILANLGEALALVHIHAINISVTFVTELIKVLGTWSRAL